MSGEATVASRALVLGGGGVTGVAWELGILAGLAEAGLDLTDADLFVGTSAGSVVAAQVTSGTPLEELYERQLASVGTEAGARMRVGVVLRLAAAALSTRDQAKAMTRIGAMALRADTMPEAERRAIFAARLSVHEWPERRMLITAVAADNGEFVAFDKSMGVSLVDAVGASCAVPGVWPPVTINGRRYMDGGMRSTVNADLAKGYERVVAVAPITASFRRSQNPAAQLARLGEGVRTVIVAPDAATKAAIGTNVLDPTRRAPAARAGRKQATDVLAGVAKVWND
jgi:NTE family protein